MILYYGSRMEYALVSYHSIGLLSIRVGMLHLPLLQVILRSSGGRASAVDMLTYRRHLAVYAT